MANGPEIEGLDSDNLLIGTANGAGLFINESLDAAAPTDTTTAWASSWVPLGYASEDGPTISTSTDTEDIRGWQSLGVLRSLVTGRTVTIQFQLMEWTAENLALYWDIDVPTPQADGSYSFEVRSDQAGRRRQLGLDVRDGSNIVRVVFPRVQLNAAGDLQFQRSAAAMLDVTFSALETNGVLLRKIVKFGGATPAHAPLDVRAGSSAAAAA